MLRAGAPIDGFGMGTSLTTSSDVAALDCVYKLQEYAGLPRRKQSTGKATWPGRKQIWRKYDSAGRMCGDILSLESDHSSGEPLLQLVMQGGRRIAPSPPLAEIRARGRTRLARLPSRCAGRARHILSSGIGDNAATPCRRGGQPIGGERIGHLSATIAFDFERWGMPRLPAGICAESNGRRCVARLQSRRRERQTNLCRRSNAPEISGQNSRIKRERRDRADKSVGPEYAQVAARPYHRQAERILRAAAQHQRQV